jgi:beta-glucosidase
MQAASSSPEDAVATHIEDALFSNRWYMDGLSKGAYPSALLEILAPYVPRGWKEDHWHPVQIGKLLPS